MDGINVDDHSGQSNAGLTNITSPNVLGNAGFAQTSQMHQDVGGFNLTTPISKMNLGMKLGQPGTVDIGGLSKLASLDPAYKYSSSIYKQATGIDFGISRPELKYSSKAYLQAQGIYSYPQEIKPISQGITPTIEFDEEEWNRLQQEEINKQYPRPGLFTKEFEEILTLPKLPIEYGSLGSPAYRYKGVDYTPMLKQFHDQVESISNYFRYNSESVKDEALRTNVQRTWDYISKIYGEDPESIARQQKLYEKRLYEERLKRQGAVPWDWTEAVLPVLNILFPEFGAITSVVTSAPKFSRGESVEGILQTGIIQQQMSEGISKGFNWLKDVFKI